MGPFGPGSYPTLTVTGSTISGNSGAYYGGGILSSSANVIVSNSVIANNTASNSYPGGSAYGGGIAMQSFFPTPGANSLTITGTTFSGNQAGGGGAIYTGPYASLSVTGSSFVGNTANGTGLRQRRRDGPRGVVAGHDHRQPVHRQPGRRQLLGGQRIRRGDRVQQPGGLRARDADDPGEHLRA